MVKFDDLWLIFVASDTVQVLGFFLRKFNRMLVGMSVLICLLGNRHILYTSGDLEMFSLF